MNESAGFSIDGQEIHKHSFWLYSVIVGLSVEEALRHVLPHVGEFSFSMTVEQRLNVALEFIRLALFLCLVVRFYLGSVRFFYQAHVSPKSNEDFPIKNYTFDFFFGLVHFSAFLALSLAIDANNTSHAFLFWLGFITLYDLLWLFGCRKFDTASLIKFWAYLNGVTFIFSIAFYLVASRLVDGWSPEWSALITHFSFMLPIFIVSFIDLREVLSSTPIFKNWILGLFPHK